MGTDIEHPVPDQVKSSIVIIDRAERQSARMSKITIDGLTRSGTGCFIAVPMWQQWTDVKGLKSKQKCLWACIGKSAASLRQ